MKKTIIGLVIIGIAVSSFGQFFPQKRKNLDIIGSFPYGMHINGHFSKTVPAGWYYNEWHTQTPKKQKGGMIKKDGKTMVEIPACDKGMIGWTSNSKKLFRPFRPISIRGMVKSGKGYRSNYPRLFITYFDKQNKFTGVKFYNIKTTADKWNNFKFVLNEKDIPAKANSFRVNFTTSALKQTPPVKPAGKVYFCDIFAAVPSSNGNSICLRGNKVANIWSLDEKVTIKPTGKFPSNAAMLIGHVFDSTGKKITEVVTPVPTVLKSGWQWKAEKPGFYQANFFLQFKDRRTIPVVEDYMMTSWINANWAVFTRQKINIAVMPDKTRKPSEVPKVFGIHMAMPKYYMKSGLPWFKKDTSYIEQLEFNFVRFHSVKWCDLERKQKNDFHWEMLDMCINWANNNGYESIINFYSTAKWASSSKDDRYILGGKNFEFFAPADMQDWRDFVRAMVKRYSSKVNTWEIWNEPHLPGSSCFWQDTPENFVKLLKAGYKTIKSEQPNSTVWMGGIGMRYVPFYNKILSLGAGKYFDRLALHGDWPNPEPFYKLDDKYNSPRHPWVNSEWHAFLIRYSYPVKYKKTDRELSKTMLVDMMNQLKNKVERITVFNISTQWYKEALKHLDKNGMRNSCNAGLITDKPFPQPRFQSVAWQNFTTLFSGNITFRGEYKLGKIKAAGLQSDKGKVLALWHDGDYDLQSGNNIKQLFGSDTKLITWEGKTVAVKNKSFNLEPVTIYYMLNPKTFPTMDKTSDSVLRPVRKMQKLRQVEKGNYITKPIFNQKNGKLLQSNLEWTSHGFIAKNTKGSAKISVKARFAIAVTAKNLQLAIEVEDNVHHPSYSKYPWNGDGIQFGIDLEGLGLQDARIEFYTKRTKDRIWLQKDRAPSIAGDLPSNWSPPRTETKHAKVFLKKLDKRKLLYLINIPNSEIYPYQLSEIQNKVRFSLLINDNDGKGRNGWIEWGSGIGIMKDPTLYGTLLRKISN